jgi:hypothetical protein
VVLLGPSSQILEYKGLLQLSPRQLPFNFLSNYLFMSHPIQLSIFRRYPSYRFLKLEQRFGEWTLPPSSGKSPTQLGPTDRAITCLRTKYPNNQ